MSFCTESCPKCFSTYALSIGTNSGLGSPRYVCGTCRTAFDSGRREWAEMGIARKLWYGLVSVLYIGGLGFATGVIFDESARQIVDLPWPNTTPPSDPMFWSMAIATGAMVAVFQWLRVRWSLQRPVLSEQAAVIPSFWSWKTNLPFYIVGGQTLLLMAAEFVGRVLRSQ